MTKRRLLLGMIVVAAIAVCLWRRGPASVTPQPYYPLRVEIATWSADGPRQLMLEIHNHSSIVQLMHLFPNLAAGESDVAERRERTVLSFFYMDEPRRRQAAVIYEGGEEVWLRGGKRQRLDGNLRLFLDALPVQRAVQLLQSRSTTEQADGQDLLRANRDAYLTTLMEIPRRQNRGLAYTGIRGVMTIVLHDTYAEFPFHVGKPLYMARTRPASRSPRHEPRADEIRRWVLELLPATSTGDSDELCVLLAATADQPTINEVAHRLSAATDLAEIQVWLDCLQRCYGTPRLYEAGGMCGNSSPEEFRAFAESERNRASAARTTLLKWHTAHSDRPAEAQHLALLQLWHAHLVREQSSYGWEFERTRRHFEFLLRRGPDVIPALDEAVATTTDLPKRSGLEFVRAYLSGKADAEIVTKLLEGTVADQRRACDIIAAAGDAGWKDQLARLIAFPVNGPNDEALVHKATETLVIVHRAEAIPLFLKDQQQVRKGGWSNSVAQQALERFTLPELAH